MTITFREAILEDSLSIEAIASKSRSEVIPSLKEIYTKSERIQFYTKEIKNKKSFVALNEYLEVIGFIIFVEGEIDHLYIEKAYRGIGVGQSLLRMATSSMQTDEVILFMFQENSLALDFYRKNGFEIAYVGDGSKNEERLPDFKLIKALRSK